MESLWQVRMRAIQRYRPRRLGQGWSPPARAQCTLGMQRGLTAAATPGSNWSAWGSLQSAQTWRLGPRAQSEFPSSQAPQTHCHRTGLATAALHGLIPLAKAQLGQNEVVALSTSLPPSSPGNKQKRGLPAQCPEFVSFVPKAWGGEVASSVVRDVRSPVLACRATAAQEAPSCGQGSQNTGLAVGLLQ